MTGLRYDDGVRRETGGSGEDGHDDRYAENG